jgi:DNA-binding NarL/FixJ family response regulator
MTATMTPRQRELVAAFKRTNSHKAAAALLGITEKGLRSQLTKIHRLTHVQRDDDYELRHQRVAREVAEGVRCRRCHLLLPCDHGLA